MNGELVLQCENFLRFGSRENITVLVVAKLLDEALRLYFLEYFTAKAQNHVIAFVYLKLEASFLILRSYPEKFIFN